MNSSRDTDRKRQRGIRASTAKIRAALIDSGLKTQAALADKIADLEGLESPPRGLVNRVCHGEPVDPPSLERVARALGVPAWLLYRSSDEPADPLKTGPSQDSVGSAPAVPPPISPASEVPIEPANGSTPREPLGGRSLRWLVLPALLLVIGGLWWFSNRGPETATSQPQPATTTLLRVVLMPIDGPHGEAVGQALSRALDPHWRVLPHIEDPSAAPPKPQELLLLGGVDRVIEPHLLEDSRWLGIVLYVHRRGAMREAWSGGWRRSMPPDQLATFWADAAQATASGDAATPRTRAALEKFLSARRYIDAANTELSVRRALTDFESALRLDPAFTDARAGLCEALVMDNVRTGDATRLTEAASECAAARKADPNNLEARRAQAYLDRKSGRLSDALTGFNAVLAAVPDHVDALLGLTEVQLTRFARGEDSGALKAAEAAAKRAQELEPQFWKPPFTLARVLYTGDRLNEAIAAAQVSVDRDPNVLALSNLGSYEFCKGDFPAARIAYERAKDAEPTAFVGDAQLAIVLYFQADYAGATKLLAQAVEQHAASGKPEEHRLWGNYADALRQAGRRSEAEAAYVRAIALAERDAASGDGNPVHASYRAFYYEMLAQLDAKRWRDRRRSDRELAELSKQGDPMAKLQLAAAYAARGDRAAATALTTEAGLGCPGYLRSPDL